jgi:hypothetical protein
MKKRWIEITRFRRRRTIVLRDNSALGIAVDPDPDAESLVRSDAAPLKEIDLDQLEATDSAAPAVPVQTKAESRKTRSPLRVNEEHIGTVSMALNKLKTNAFPNNQPKER